MADDTDVITLDSDDEDTSNSSLPNANNGIAIKRVTGGITHGSPGSAIRLPLPPNLRTSSPGVSGRQMMSGSPRKQVPRKPGVFPPFALFSQEHRAEVVASQENIGFGDVGRKLGEMWHSLSEDQKENYRRRAREISDQKMAEYQASLSKMSPQQRQMAIRQANTPSQKKRRTHGYAIFSAEMRKNLGQAMNPQETANVIAESWRSASPSVRRDYEERAARVNAAQLRRIAPGPVPSVQPQSSQQQRIQYAQSAASNGTGLRISSVSSLSPQTKKPPSQLGPRLPSGITISRVEPDISIVSEQIPQRLVAQTPPRFPPTVQHTTGTRGRPPARKPTMSPAAQAAMRVKAQLRAQQQSQGGYNGHTQWNAQVPTRGSGMVGRPRGRGSASMYGSMMKRPAPGMTGINAKVPRMMRPVQMPNRIEQRLCRSCGLISPVGCKLADRPEILQTLIELTMTSIDLMKDQMEGFPGEVCKRCMISINNFSAFKRTFETGQSRLKTHIDRLRPALQTGTDNIAADSDEPTVYVDNANVDIVTPNPGSSSSAGISEDSNAEESILPDLDCEVDYGENPANIPQPVNIKVEKVRVITPSQEKIRIKSEISLSMDSDNIVADPNQEKVGERCSSPKKDAAEECDDSDSVSKDSNGKKENEENAEKAENDDENEIDASNGDKESFDPLTCTEGNNYDEDSISDMINSDIPEDSNDHSDEGNQKENEVTTPDTNTNENSSDLNNLAEDDEKLLENDQFETEEYIGTNEEEEDSLLNGTDTTQDIPSSSNDGMDLLEDQENTEDADHVTSNKEEIPSTSSNDGMGLLDDQENIEDMAAEIDDSGHETSNRKDVLSSSNDGVDLINIQENNSSHKETISDNDNILTVANNVEDVSKDDFDDNAENSNVVTRTEDEILEHNISSADDDNLLGKEMVENSDLINEEEASNTAGTGDGDEINPLIEMDENSTERESSSSTKNSNLQIMVGIDEEDANDAFVAPGRDNKDTNNEIQYSNDENEDAH